MFEFRCESYMKMVKLYETKAFQLFINDKLFAIIIQLNIRFNLITKCLILIRFHFHDLFNFVEKNYYLYYCYLIDFLKGLFSFIMLF